MTHTKHVIKTISETNGWDEKLVTQVFEAVNSYDWSVFCSQMGDYDHPEERLIAGRTLNDMLEKISTQNNVEPSTIEEIKKAVGSNTEYYAFFHHMEDEV